VCVVWTNGKCEIVSHRSLNRSKLTVAAAECRGGGTGLALFVNQNHVVLIMPGVVGSAAVSDRRRCENISKARPSLGLTGDVIVCASR